MSRTGTISLLTALNRLGYKTYHGAHATACSSRDMPCWMQALEAKFLGVGQEWGREEFSKILGPYYVRDLYSLYRSPRQGVSCSLKRCALERRRQTSRRFTSQKSSWSLYPEGKVIMT